jgi:hypothetical protein
MKSTTYVIDLIRGILPLPVGGIAVLFIYPDE